MYMPLVRKALSRSGFKSVWTDYINGNISYTEFRAALYLINCKVCRMAGERIPTPEEHDKAWQWTTPGSEDYKTARYEMLALINFGRK